MADKLTDEEKAKAIVGNVEEKTPVETTEPEVTPTEEEQPSQEVEETEEEEPKAPETGPETQTTFTKQFPNLKGDTPEDYVKELETAYTNSTNEALRLKKITDDSTKLIDEAKAIIAGTTQPESTPTAPTNPSMLQVDSLPEIQYAKAQMQKDMISAFDEFTKDYPMARETDEFNKFTAASDGVASAFKAGTGRDPSYPELYKQIASILGWQPIAQTGKKEQAIKDASVSSQTSSATQPPPRQSKVTDAEVDAYMNLMSNKPMTRADAIKALSEVK